MKVDIPKERNFDDGWTHPASSSFYHHQPQWPPPPPPPPPQQQNERLCDNGYRLPANHEMYNRSSNPNHSSPRHGFMTPMFSDCSSSSTLLSDGGYRRYDWFDTWDLIQRLHPLRIGSEREPGRSPAQFGRNPFDPPAVQRNRGKGIINNLTDDSLSSSSHHSLLLLPNTLFPEEECPYSIWGSHQQQPLLSSSDRLHIPSSFYLNPISSRYNVSSSSSSSPHHLRGGSFAPGGIDSHGGNFDRHLPFQSVSDESSIGPNRMIHPSGISNYGYHQFLQSLVRPHATSGFACEDTFIIQGKELPRVWGRGSSRGDREWERERRRPQMYNRFNYRVSPVDDDINKYEYLRRMPGNVLAAANDQHGCRYLQRMLEMGTPEDVDIIFNEIIDHVLDLMINPFGNYLVQKLLDLCSEAQTMKIIIVLTEDPAAIVPISLDSHGTRVVQKLIVTLKTREQIALVTSSLQPGFLILAKDQNGNHVIHRCLLCLSYEDNKFIFDGAIEHCVELATSRQGCCVLMRIMTHASGNEASNLFAEITMNGLLIAQDEFGNYVAQQLLVLRDPVSNERLMALFRGKYVHLSKQKCSSNVVEKCLLVFGEEGRKTIIGEFLAVPSFGQILQHPFANYVIQSALNYSQGFIRVALVNAIRPYSAALKTSPFSRKLISRTILGK